MAIINRTIKNIKNLNHKYLLRELIWTSFIFSLLLIAFALGSLYERHLVKVHTPIEVHEPYAGTLFFD
jgi:hypothetical protein